MRKKHTHTLTLGNNTTMNLKRCISSIIQSYSITWAVRMMPLPLLTLPCTATVLDNINTTGAPDGIVTPLPASVGSSIQGQFNKYTRLTASNGKHIHLLAQSQVSNMQLGRARRILEFYLTSHGQTYGHSGTAGNGTIKVDIANTMANRGAILVYTNNPDNLDAPFNALGSLAHRGQDLGATESPIPGSAQWMNNTNRDASYEEIFHLVHFQGITRVNTTLTAWHNGMVKPASDAAWGGSTAASIFHPSQSLYNEWHNEGNSDLGQAEGVPGGSVYQEYIISVIDSYYGQWGYLNGASNGFYDPTTRALTLANDAAGAAAVRAFLPDMLTYEEKLDPSFSGTFQLTFDSTKSYTHKSQYFTQVTLTGTNASNLIGNDSNNTLTGNTANNQLTGGKGNDQLDGANGTDIAIFTGPRSQYTITRANGITRVQDNTANRDGTDTLRNIETLRFSDGDINAEPLQSWLKDRFPTNYGNTAQETSIWGLHADPDNDGRNNFEEYTDGTNPNKHDQGNSLTSTISGSTVILKHHFSKTRPDIGYTIQYSDTLISPNWQDATSYTMDSAGQLTRTFHGELTQPTPPSENAGRWQIQENFAPSPTQQKRFFRVKRFYRP